ncbi:MAG: phosphodiester glycosidase family protein [Actinomycetes bacterium]
MSIEEVTPAAVKKTLRQRPILASILAVLVIAGVSLIWSVGSALTAPGTDTVAARLAEWGRDHYLGFVVTTAESIQYKLHPPKVGGAPNSNLLNGTSVPVIVGDHAPLTPLLVPALAGEGTFRTVVTVKNQPAIQVAYMRPDEKHSSYLAGISWMSGSLLKFVQHPGHSEPGKLSLWSQKETIVPADRNGLLATFNSGFKMKDSQGGYYENGNTVGVLRPGGASLVIYRDGHADIGTWGTTVQMTPDVLSVRQNLSLLVDNGQLAASVDSKKLSTWGMTVKNAYFVWRSGIGVTATGDFVYVAGDALSVHTLASLLQAAGAVRAMELDINTQWISYMWYEAGKTPTTPIAKKLLGFARPAKRYFSISSRDFFAVYAR